MAFVEEQIYHVFNRGIENKVIFPSKKDYQRFIDGLLFFNTSKPIELRYLKNINTVVAPPEKGKRIIEMLSYCLMKDHVHLLVKIITPFGAEQFFRKIFGAYTRYFNLKYKRHGVLFESRSKSKHIDDNLYFEQILRYIHLNPLDYFDVSWRNHKIKNFKEAKEFILNYPWSSLKEILGKTENVIIDDVKGIIEFEKDFLDFLLSWSSEDFEDGGLR